MNVLTFAISMNVIVAVVVTILMLRRTGKMLMIQHEKSHRLGWEDGADWVFDMTAEEYVVMRRARRIKKA